MRSRTFACLTAGWLAVAAAPPAAAQQPLADPSVAGVRLELAALNETLERIETLILRHLEGQKLNLVLQRIEVTAARIARDERELQSLRAESRSIDDERRRSTLALEDAEERLPLFDPEGDEIQQARRFIEESEIHLRRLDERQAEIDSRAALLENGLASMRREMEDWQDYFDREVVEE